MEELLQALNVLQPLLLALVTTVGAVATKIISTRVRYLGKRLGRLERAHRMLRIAYTTLHDHVEDLYDSLGKEDAAVRMRITARLRTARPEELPDDTTADN